MKKQIIFKGKINEVVKQLHDTVKSNYSRLTVYELILQMEHENFVKGQLAKLEKEKNK